MAYDFISRRPESVRFGSSPDSGVAREGQGFERALFGEVNKVVHDELLNKKRMENNNARLDLWEMVEIVKRAQPPEYKRHVFLKDLDQKTKEIIELRARSFSPSERMKLRGLNNDLHTYTAVKSMLDDFYVAGSPRLSGQSGRDSISTMDAFVEIKTSLGKRSIITIDATTRDKSAEGRTIHADVEIRKGASWKDRGENETRYAEQVRDIANKLADNILKRFSADSLSVQDRTKISQSSVAAVM